MRKFTIVLIIMLFLSLVGATIFQVLLGRGERNLPGPTVSLTPGP